MVHLIEVGTLRQEYIFVIDNCSVHMQGCSQYLQEDLFNYLGIMISLSPYHPELNPTELVFNILVQRMKSKQTRSLSKSNRNFSAKIENEMMDITREDVKGFYK